MTCPWKLQSISFTAFCSSLEPQLLAQIQREREWIYSFLVETSSDLKEHVELLQWLFWEKSLLCGPKAHPSLSPGSCCYPALWWGRSGHTQPWSPTSVTRPCPSCLWFCAALLVSQVRTLGVRVFTLIPCWASRAEGAELGTWWAGCKAGPNQGERKWCSLTYPVFPKHILCVRHCSRL